MLSVSSNLKFFVSYLSINTVHRAGLDVVSTEQREELPADTAHVRGQAHGSLLHPPDSTDGGVGRQASGRVVRAQHCSASP